MNSPEPARNVDVGGIPTPEDCLLVALEALIAVMEGCDAEKLPRTSDEVWNEALSDAKITVAAVRALREKRNDLVRKQ